METHTGKLDQRAWEGRLVGYSPNSRANRICNPRTRKAVTSRNVIFIELLDAAMPPPGSDDDNEDNLLTGSPECTMSGNKGENNQDSLPPDDDDGLMDSSSDEDVEDDEEDGLISRRVLRSTMAYG